MMAPRSPRHLPHRAAFFVLAAFLLATLALLPVAFSSVIADVIENGNRTYFVLGDHQHQDPDRVMLNLRMNGLDEWQRTVSIQVSGHRDCSAACTGTDRIQFISIPLATEDGEGLPPYVFVTFPPGSRTVSDKLELPVSGRAIRYPFDTSRLELGVVAQRSNAEGGFRTLTEADRFLYLSLNGSIPRAIMQPPQAVPISRVFVDDPTWRFAGVWQINFTRPLYLQVVTIVMLVLVSLASVYAVILVPLRDLVISAGALILGVWGIRAIVLGTNLAGFTIIDLSLMLVILFLLVAITWRTLQHLHDRGELSVPLFRRESEAPKGEATPETPPRPAETGSATSNERPAV